VRSSPELSPYHYPCFGQQLSEEVKDPNLEEATALLDRATRKEKLNRLDYEKLS
jgi:hypothetical protein